MASSPLRIGGDFGRCLPIFWLILLLITGWFAFSQGLNGSFFFDDIPNIVFSENIRIVDLSPGSLLDALLGGRSSPLGRPIAQLSFSVNHYLGGLAPHGYKITNLIIHLATGVLVYRLALLLFRPFLSQHQVSVPALFLTATWLLHPIQALPVFHVVQRMTSLSGFFLLAGLVLHIDGRQKKNITKIAIAWVVFWPLSILSKETGILFPWFVFIWEFVLHKREQGQLDRFARILAVTIGTASSLAILYSMSAAGQWIWDGYQLREFTPTQRLLTESRVLWFYLRLILSPNLEAFGLYHDDIAISTSIFAPLSTLFSLTGIGLLLTIAWKIRTKAPIITFGILWFFAGHIVESTVLSLEIAHEHRNYLPSIGALLVIISGFVHTAPKGGKSRTIALTLSLAFVTYLTVLTTLRANQYENEIRRTQIEAQHHEHSARAQFDAGAALSNLDDALRADSPTHYFARRHFEIANELDQNAKMPLFGLIQLNCRALLPVESNWILLLRQRLSSTPFAPGDQSVIYALKSLAAEIPECLSTNQAHVLFQAPLSNPNAPNSAKAAIYSWYADYLWLVQHDLAGAMSALKSSLALVPHNNSNKLKWAQLTFLAGDFNATRDLLLQLSKMRLSADEKQLLIALLSDQRLSQHEPIAGVDKQ